MTRPIDVKCPACKSAPGKPCVDHGIAIRKIHKSRRKAAHAGQPGPLPPVIPTSPRLPFAPDLSTAATWLRIKCPACKAAKGKPCVEPSGEPRKPHTIRRKMAVQPIRVVSGGLPSLGKGRP